MLDNITKDTPKDIDKEEIQNNRSTIHIWLPIQFGDGTIN